MSASLWACATDRYVLNHAPNVRIRSAAEILLQRTGTRANMVCAGGMRAAANECQTSKTFNIGGHVDAALAQHLTIILGTLLAIRATNVKADLVCVFLHAVTVIPRLVAARGHTQHRVQVFDAHSAKVATADDVLLFSDFGRQVVATECGERSSELAQASLGDGARQMVAAFARWPSAHDRRADLAAFLARAHFLLAFLVRATNVIGHEAKYAFLIAAILSAVRRQQL